MTTQATDASRLLALADAASTDRPDADGELSVHAASDNSLWTNGLPDPIKIKRRMQETADEYIAQPYPVMPRDKWQWANEIAELHKRQALFYSQMQYYESLLYAPPVLPLPVSSTTTIVPYAPTIKRKRGRPATGRRPRASRRNTDADPY